MCWLQGVPAQPISYCFECRSKRVRNIQARTLHTVFAVDACVCARARPHAGLPPFLPRRGGPKSPAGAAFPITGTRTHLGLRCRFRRFGRCWCFSTVRLQRTLIAGIPRGVLAPDNEAVRNFETDISFHQLRRSQFVAPLIYPQMAKGAVDMRSRRTSTEHLLTTNHNPFYSCPSHEHIVQDHLHLMYFPPEKMLITIIITTTTNA